MYLDDLAGEKNLGFAQTVHVSTPIRYELGALETRVGAASEIRIGFIGQEGKPHPGVVTPQTPSDVVRIQFREEPACDGLGELTTCIAGSREAWSGCALDARAAERAARCANSRVRPWVSAQRLVWKTGTEQIGLCESPSLSM